MTSSSSSARASVGRRSGQSDRDPSGRGRSIGLPAFHGFRPAGVAALLTEDAQLDATVLRPSVFGHVARDWLRLAEAFGGQTATRNSATRQWFKKVMRSRIEPMKKIARMIRGHKPLILNWFEARGQVSLGAVEGLNNKLKASIGGSYGFRTAKAIKIMLYHKLGELPEPELTHRFC